jgi:hypothetical protein
MRVSPVAITPGAAVPVGQAWRNYQLSAAADLHALHALIPADDDLPSAELERERFAPVPASVEFLARGVRDPDIVNLDHPGSRPREWCTDLKPAGRLAVS